MPQQLVDAPTPQEQRLMMSYEEFLEWAGEDTLAEWVNGFVARAHQDRLTPERLEGPADLVIELISDSRHLISNLRCGAALVLPYDGPYQGRGPRRKYGAKLDYQHLPADAL